MSGTKNTAQKAAGRNDMHFSEKAVQGKKKNFKLTGIQTQKVSERENTGENNNRT